MTSHVGLLLAEYRAKGILIDANLLLLYLVGSYDLRLVGDGKYNKLSRYSVEDYRLLLRFRSLFKKAVTTPHVLTEVGNLTGDLPAATKSDSLATFCQTFSEVDEVPAPSFEAAHRAEFPFLGLTDCALVQLTERYLVVSDDGRMVAELNRSGLNALNFNHLRSHLFV